MIGFIGNIEEQTNNNSNFRKVLHTGQHIQLVIMSLKPNEEIGLEVHETTDQFFRFESGKGKVILNRQEHMVKDGDAVIVPAGVKHNVINTSSTDCLKLYTLYSPPNHKASVVHKTKQEAKSDSSDHFNNIL